LWGKSIAMKYFFAFSFWIFFSFETMAQNVGIGTTSPGFPLNFSNALGDKISLYGNSGAHYGFGIQGGLFQIHSDAAAANIAFGYGSSTSFTERMRIINSGENGLLLNGRLTLRNGTMPVDPNQTPGIWIYKPDNSGLLGFVGAQNNQNIGFYGGPAGWGFTYDAVNSRVGIGTSNPNAPLSFPASTGRKITLYPGSAGNVGLGVHANELRIHTDYEPADVTVGYENLQGVFTERFRFRGNGAMSVNGNAGNAGQVLTSNGNGNAVSWSNKPTSFHFSQHSSVFLNGTATETVIPGLNEQQFTISQTSRVVFTTHLYLATNVFGSPRTETVTEIKNAAFQRVGYADNFFQFHDYPGQSIDYTGITVSLPPGTYSIFVKTRRTSTIDGELNVWKDGDCACQGGQLILQVFPE
jgi:hypothetical protein